MAAARAVTGEEQNNWEIFTIFNSEYSSTKCSSPTIVVSDSKPVPFKPYETTKDVKAKVRRLFLREINYLLSPVQAVENKRASENGSSKSVSPHIDTR